jgi:hypothetical protein
MSQYLSVAFFVNQWTSLASHGDQFCLRWEQKSLQALGKALRDIVKKQIVSAKLITTPMKFIIKICR